MSKGAPDYTKITLLKGAAPDGSLVTLAVDTSGNILAVLKGEYDGVLKTVQTDVNGLLLAKIYDPDDIFGVSGTIGLGELAARLGSTMNFDRRGQLVWYDDFEASILKWNVVTSGIGASAALSGANAFLKSQAVKLIAGSTVSSLVMIEKHIALQAAARVGLECAIGYNATLQPTQVTIQIDFYNNSVQHAAQVTWDIGLSKIWLMTGYNTDWVAIASNVPALAQNLMYTKFKLVADFSTGKYVRLMYGSTSIDISAYDIPTTGTADPTNLRMSITNIGAPGINCECWVDDVTLTYREP
jgi:hypothetical protein